jgi:hypothetical protein
MNKPLQRSEHQLERIEERFDIFTSKDLAFAVKNHIKRNISLLNKIELDEDKSYGILLGHFKPNDKSEHYVSIANERAYYRIMDDEVISDSTGDQFWAVVRRCKITTFMLRKGIQTENLAHNLKKLDVDEVINNLPKFIKDSNEQDI